MMLKTKRSLLMGLFFAVFLIFSSFTSVSGAEILGELGDAIDISQGTGEITVDDVRCWVGSGVRHIIVKAAIDEEWSGTNHNRDTSRQQLETLWRAKYEEGLDFSVDIYLYVHWPPNDFFETPVPDQVREAIDLLGELAIGPPSLPVGRLWIDLEDAPPVEQSLADTVSLIREALEACGSFPCGIYTRKTWWDENTLPNTTEFSNYPLWYAHYGCPLNPTFSDFEEFGGWTEPFGKQYADNKEENCSDNLCSKSVDYDIMYLSPKRADLELSDISFTLSPTAGVQTTAVARLTNIGEVASGSFNVKWFLDGVQVGYGGHTSLAPGEVSTGNVRFDWTPTAGQHTLRFSADVDNHVQEGNETNNSFELTVNVPEPPTPADLKVSGITFTSYPKAGVSTTAIAQLSNVGGSDSGVFSVKWFLDGAQVGYGGHSSLAPGEVSSGNVRFTWTPTPGVHTLRFVADADNHVTESNEDNNSYQVTFSVLAPPDLKVSGITFTSYPKAGVSTTAVAQLSNEGESASGVFAVKWFLDGVQVGYGGHSSLAPGEVSTGNVRFTWTPTPGVHTLRFVADSDNHVAESNEYNNSYQVTFGVLGFPDLQVSGITLSPYPKVGVTTTATARLANVGQSASGGFNVKWFLNGVQVGYGYHAPLGAGQVSTDNVRFTWTPTPGVHTLRFEADVDKQVAESNENNNSYQVTVIVVY